jgi:hypothetical protein
MPLMAAPSKRLSGSRRSVISVAISCRPITTAAVAR